MGGRGSRIGGSYTSPASGAPVETNATRMCALLVGLPDVNVIGVADVEGQPLRVHVETIVTMSGCAGCGSRAWSKGGRQVELVDLAAFGRPALLVWHKRRWCCPEASCDVGTFTEIAPAIAAARSGVTDRAGRWMCRQSARAARSRRSLASSAATGTR